MAKTSHTQCRGPGSDPWSGKCPVCHNEDLVLPSKEIIFFFFFLRKKQIQSTVSESERLNEDQ